MKFLSYIYWTLLENNKKNVLTTTINILKSLKVNICPYLTFGSHDSHDLESKWWELYWTIVCSTLSYFWTRSRMQKENVKQMTTSKTMLAKQILFEVHATYYQYCTKNGWVHPELLQCTRSIQIPTLTICLSNMEAGYRNRCGTTCRHRLSLYTRAIFAIVNYD